MPIHTLGRLTEPEQFGDIIVKLDGNPTGDSSGPAPWRASPAWPPIATAASSPSTAVARRDHRQLDGFVNPQQQHDGQPRERRRRPPAWRPAAAHPQAAAASSLGGGGAAGGGTTGGAATGVGRITVGTAPTMPTPSIVRLRDVARIELGATNYNQACTFDGQPSVGLGVYQLPGTNALDVADRVRAKMEELKTRFPDGVDYDIAYDTTPFIRESVNDVMRTLLEAVVLVGLVVLVFLQNWRAVIIPLIAVPVAIIGTFARHGRARLQPEQHLAVRPGAGDRHRRG